MHYSNNHPLLLQRKASAFQAQNTTATSWPKSLRMAPFWHTEKKVTTIRI